MGRGSTTIANPERKKVFGKAQEVRRGEDRGSDLRGWWCTASREGVEGGRDGVVYPLFMTKVCPDFANTRSRLG